MQIPVEIQSQGLTLRGMLHRPDNTHGKIPVVIIFHGFTGSKMEPHFIFVKLSRMLEKHGIASIRFDFGGSGESDGDFIDMTPSGELKDAEAILDYVKTIEFIDLDRVGVVGLSMGGAIASMLAGLRKDEIKALCLWAPAGNMREGIMDRYTREEIEEVKKKGYKDLGGLLLGNGFVEDIKNIDIYKKAEGYDKSVLILHGDHDSLVPLGASERYLELFEKQAVLHIIEGADHTFNKKEWEEEVLDYTVGFLSGELL